MAIPLCFRNDGTAALLLQNLYYSRRYQVVLTLLVLYDSEIGKVLHDSEITANYGVHDNISASPRRCFLYVTTPV